VFRHIHQLDGMEHSTKGEEGQSGGLAQISKKFYAKTKQSPWISAGFPQKKMIIPCGMW
jgi:hypothetical protein